MNLATDKWIPVVRMDGKPDLVSLEQAFDEAEQIRDLAVRPHERIALMRLLLAVAHAGLDGPKNERDWRTCREGVGPAGVKHLQETLPCFELLGSNGPRFLQVPGLKPANDDKKPTPVTKLDLLLATGANSTIFDHGAATLRKRAHEQLALNLVTYQCFSPGSPLGAAIWNRLPTRSAQGKEAKGGKTYGSDGPCINGGMLHTLLIGQSLAETIWLNLIDRKTIEETYGVDAWGEVVWRKPPSGPEDLRSIENATRTYLGRLMPLSRAALIQEDFVHVTLSNGLEYPMWIGTPAEPMGTVVALKEGKRTLLKACLDRAVWRDLPSLAAKRRSGGNCGALSWQRFPEDRACDFWVGALVTDGSAKVLNTVESTFALPANTRNNDFIEYFQGGELWAEAWAGALERGIMTYRRTLGDKEGAGKMKLRAATYFWTAIEAGARDILIPLAAQPPDELKVSSSFKLDYSRLESRWGPVVRRAALDAYPLVCPKGSARQAAAYGRGRNAMLRKQPSGRPRPASKPGTQPQPTREL